MFDFQAEAWLQTVCFLGRGSVSVSASGHPKDTSLLDHSRVDNDHVSAVVSV